MKEITVLGPKGTFSDKALIEYKKYINEEVQVVYNSSIDQVLEYAYLNNVCAIIPIENSIDGFVDISLDKINEYNLNIVSELILPISFSYVSNYSIEEVDVIYVQFKTKGQCSKFLNHKNCIITNSNIESLEMLKDNKLKCGAIIPIDIDSDYNIRVDKVEDESSNFTRFLVVEKEDSNSIDSKVSCIVSVKEDKPGLLVDILQDFKSLNYNLVFILSRPTKKTLGKYDFYIDFMSNKKVSKNDIANAFKDKDYNVKILGIYSVLNDK